MQKYFTEAIIENLPDALFAINKEGEIVIWNKALEKLTNTKKSKVLGKGNYEYSYVFYGKRTPGLVDTLLDKTGEIEKLYINFKREGNTVTGERSINGEKTRYFKAWASILYNKNGRTILGEVVTIRDITKEKHYEEKIKKYIIEQNKIFNGTMEKHNIDIKTAIESSQNIIKTISNGNGGVENGR